MSEFNLPESLEGLTSEDLQGLHDAALAEFTTLNESDDASAETLERMEYLADSIEALRAQRQSLADNAARLAGVRNRMAAFESQPQPDPNQPQPDPNQPAPDDGENDGTAQPEPPQPQQPESDQPQQPVTAGGARPGALVPSTRVPEAARPALVITAAADIPQITSGSQLDLDQVARAMHLKARTLSDHSGWVPVATAEKHFESGYDLTQLSRVEAYEAIMDNSGAGALTASGGWCAPSEILYDFFDLECARGSTLTLPTFRATRGGVQYPTSSPLPAVNTTDWIHTEDDDIAGYEKPCITIPCPDFDEVRLAAHGICVTAGNLMDRAYPENVRRYLNQVFIAHERNENLRKIAVLTGGSTHATFAATFAAASALINSALLAAATYRDKYRMCDGARLEAVFPLWARDVIRADVARQQGSLSGDVSGLPTNAEINTWFDNAGISAQFVNDWQALATTTTTTWPTTVDFLMYAPGTWVEFNGGTLDLGVVRDSVLNSTNDFTAAWMEEFWAIGMRGYESVLVTTPICPSGAVGMRSTYDCA
jgi:hypothetical protein